MATTGHLDFKILGSRRFDDQGHHHVLAQAESPDGLLLSHLLYHERDPSTPVAEVALLAPPGTQRLWEVRMMHVTPEYRGKGIGKQMWNAVRAAHPNSKVVALPDPVKDQAVSKVDLAHVYRAYGFEDDPDRPGWFRTYGTEHPAYKQPRYKTP
jgi:GNAT superfamily N-acetyltransferase